LDRQNTETDLFLLQELKFSTCLCYRSYIYSFSILQGSEQEAFGR